MQLKPPELKPPEFLNIIISIVGTITLYQDITASFKTSAWPSPSGNFQFPGNEA